MVKANLMCMEGAIVVQSILFVFGDFLREECLDIPIKAVKVEKKLHFANISMKTKMWGVGGRSRENAVIIFSYTTLFYRLLPTALL